MNVSLSVSLHDVQDADLPTFFEQQLDLDAQRMAGFPGRSREPFMRHWAKIRADDTTIVKTIHFEGNVAGNIVSWEHDGAQKVGYWLGKEFWGKGIASAALVQFLTLVTLRPLHARVAKHNMASIRVLQKCGFTICGEDKFSLSGGEMGEEFVLGATAFSTCDSWALTA